ncbi:hypothetical protein [Sporosarcina newyorkensis]|uniref:Uncharacterized protein n=1 Tax=Sporosarcina newyorkensis TaxID=759851 RepID=A0A1T4XJS9_9BACL|nr:hypothetical protein [Sporosarcina newyorkensis]SKA89822.1 hypothetical protein SAMN04244570_0888 [Sporosarcina newyorkensis]
MNKKKQVIKLSFISLMLVLSGVLLAACSKAGAEDVNVGVIKNVLELQFNGPDEKFMALIHDPTYTTVVEGYGVNSELDKYVQEVYGPYFTELYVETFLNTIGLNYPVTAYNSGNKLNLKDAVIEKSKEASNRYTFSATVGYQKDGEKEKSAEVSGVVLFSTKEKGKIGKFEYEDDNGFSEELTANE